MRQHETANETAWNSNETAWNSAVKYHEPNINRKKSISLWSPSPIQGVSLAWNKVFRDHETNCFILLQGVSWPWNSVSSWFKVFHDHFSSWFNMFHGVSRPWNKLFHCWIILNQHVSSLFHLSDSSCFMLIQTVSSLFHHCFNSGNEPLAVSPFVWRRCCGNDAT